MARRIYKWALPVGPMSVPWSLGDKVLMVADQPGNGLCLWAEQEDSQPAPWRKLQIIGTGFDAPEGYGHVGSAICGEFVWHVYAEPVVP